LAVTFSFIIFKILYPFPDFFSDSYSYIFAATVKADINTWPIGYSKFLQWFPWLTRSHQALIFFQFFTYELFALYFFFTVDYLFRMRKFLRRILTIFLFFNPLIFYTANYVTSDILFIALSLLWLTEVLWILYRPKWYQILLQGVLVFALFTLRYNAMIYPAIGALAFLISKHRLALKWSGIAFGPVLIVLFILHSRSAAKEMTGTAQFPILAGWQWGNNALYFREFIQIDSTSFPTAETARLDSIARQFYRTVPYEQRDLPNYVANYFIRVSNAPLKIYLHSNYPIHDELSNMVAWGQASPVFGEYGRFLIRKYPGAFFRHFIVVNARNYILPPLEKLEVYNLGMDTVFHGGQRWFLLPSVKVWSVSKHIQGLLLLPFPILFLMLNILYACSLIYFMSRTGFEQAGIVFSKSIIVVTSLLVLNCGFSILANIIVIRYQIFPMLLFISFGLVILDKILQQKETLSLEAMVQRKVSVIIQHQINV
jgi:hypothetical protein